MTQLRIIYLLLIVAGIFIFFWIKNNKHLKDKGSPG